MAGTGNVDPSSPPQPPEARPEATPPPRSMSGRRWVLTLGVVAAVLVVATVVAYVATGGFHLGSNSSGSQGQVLVPNGTSYSMIVGQFNGINFVATAHSTISGQINSSRGIALYIFTATEFQYLTKNLVVGSYVWTSGTVADNAVYNVDISVAPGQWVLSFLNPNEYTPTGVTFYTDLVLNSS